MGHAAHGCQLQHACQAGRRQASLPRSADASSDTPGTAVAAGQQAGGRPQCAAGSGGAPGQGLPLCSPPERTTLLVLLVRAMSSSPQTAARLADALAAVQARVASRPLRGPPPVDGSLQQHLAELAPYPRDLGLICTQVTTLIIMIVVAVVVVTGNVALPRYSLLTDRVWRCQTGLLDGAQLLRMHDVGRGARL
jgi:hypothetical protein